MAGREVSRNAFPRNESMFVKVWNVEKGILRDMKCIDTH